MDSSERRHLPLRGLSGLSLLHGHGMGSFSCPPFLNLVHRTLLPFAVIGAEVLWWNRFTMLTEQLLHQIFNSSYCPAGHRTGLYTTLIRRPG